MAPYSVSASASRFTNKPYESEFSFSFVRATNLASFTAGHTHHLTVARQDNNHFSEAWTWSDNGKDRTEVFHFTRKS